MFKMCTTLQYMLSYHRHFLNGTGVLLDDLLVAEDLAAAETTSAALHAAAASSAAPVSPPPHSGKPQEVRKSPHPDSSPADGASVVMASPVAAPISGDTTMDISTENAMSHGHR